MKIFLFSDREPSADDADFIEAMLNMLNSLPAPNPKPKPAQRIDRLYSDDVLKLARELNLSVEDTIEVMSFKRK